MIKINNTEVFGFSAAIRDMSNSIEPPHKSDSYLVIGQNPDEVLYTYYRIGPNDMKLAKKFIADDPNKRDFLEMIHVQCDCLAPLYWWEDYNILRFGTFNLYSHLNKITGKELTLKDFSINNFEVTDEPNDGLNLTDYMINIVADCEEMRSLYNKTSDKKYWYGLVQLLPNSYNQNRIIDLNYKELMSIYNLKVNSELIEWQSFCDWILTLPYMKDFLNKE